MKKNTKAGKASLLVVVACMVVMSLAAVAQADSVLPLEVGYTWDYNATYGNGSTGTGTLTITGTENIGGTQWSILNITNFNKYGQNEFTDVRSTSDTLYRLPDTTHIVYPMFKEAPVGSSWTYTNDSGYPETATVLSIGQLTVPTGTYSNVYNVFISDPTESKKTLMYFLPGVGILELIFNDKGAISTDVLTSYGLKPISTLSIPPTTVYVINPVTKVESTLIQQEEWYYDVTVEADYPTPFYLPPWPYYQPSLWGIDTGFDLNIGPGNPNIATITPPVIYTANWYDLYSSPNGLWEYMGLVPGGETYSFLTGGVDRVRLINTVDPVSSTGLTVVLTFVADGTFTGSVIPDAVAVPEPTTMLLLGSGLIGLAGLRRKFRN